MQTGAALVVVLLSALVSVSFAAEPSPKTVLVAAANGTDDIETVIVTSVLRRAGLQVKIGTLGCHAFKSGNDILIEGDVPMKELESVGEYDAVILPGGLEGVKKFSESSSTGKYLKKHEEAGKLIGAICGGPLILKKHGIGKGKKATANPKVEAEVKEGDHFVWSDDRVVVDGNLITSRAPGTAFEFALAIVKNLLGDKAETEVAEPLLLK